MPDALTSVDPAKKLNRARERLRRLACLLLPAAAAAYLFARPVALAVLAAMACAIAGAAAASYAERHRIPIAIGDDVAPTYRSGDDTLAACARRHFERRWKTDRFDVVGERRRRAWWGGEIVEVDVDSGWERAYVRMVLLARNGWLLRCAFVPKPGCAASDIGENEAVAIVRAEAAKRGNVVRDPIRVVRRGARWDVWTNAGAKGRNVRASVDAVAGVIVDYAYWPR